jgi:hypothetical protein
MIDPKLAEYISAHIKAGESKENIRKTLIETGWTAEMVDEALAHPEAHSETVPEPPHATVLKGATELWNEAFEIYKKHYQILISIIAVTLVPSAVLSVFSDKNITASVVNTFGAAVSGLSSLILMILTIVVSSWGQVSLMYAVKDREKGITVSQAFGYGWQKILSYWWVMILGGVIALGGFILFIIPGFYIAVWFSLASFVIVAEEEKGMNALLKSREYVKGRVASVFWRCLFLGLTSLLVAIPAGILFVGLPEPWRSVFSGSVTSLLFTPFGVIYLYLLYRELAVLKGEFVFASEQKTKRIFVAIGVLGILAPFSIILFVGAAVLSHPSLFSSF